MASQDCVFCGHQVDQDDPDTYREVVSWVNGPKLDGPKLREQTGGLAHKTCVENLAAGQAADQATLFDNEAAEKYENMEWPNE